MNTFKYCESCGNQIAANAEKCPHCGKQFAIQEQPSNTKFCQHCGQVIAKDCVICPKCGKRVVELKAEQPQVVINNSNTNTNINGAAMKKEKNKWLAFFLCLFLGEFGIHRFYEGKIGTGILWLITLGLFGIGWLVDLIIILCKPNPYYV